MQLFTYKDFFLLYLEAELVLAEALDFCEYKLKLSRGEFAISVPGTCVLPKHIDNGRLILLRPEQSLGFGLFAHREQFTMISSAMLAALVIEVTGHPREIKSLADIRTTKPETKLVTDVPDKFRNMLLDVRIEGKYPPMAHQFSAAWFKATHARAFDLSTMRTGKTGSTMLALEYLFRTQAIKHVMVLAPLSCVHPVWVDAIHQTMLQHVVDAGCGIRFGCRACLQECVLAVENLYQFIEYRMHDGAVLIAFQFAFVFLVGVAQVDVEQVLNPE